MVTTIFLHSSTMPPANHLTGTPTPPPHQSSHPSNQKPTSSQTVKNTALTKSMRKKRRKRLQRTKAPAKPTETPWSKTKRWQVLRQVWHILQKKKPPVTRAKISKARAAA